MKKFIFIISFVLIAGIFSSEAQSPALINGVFNMYKETIIENTQTQNRNSATAFFAYSPVAVVSPSIFAKAGEIKLNDKKVKYDQNGKFYASKIKKNNNDPDDDPEEFCNTSPIEPMHWKVTGHDAIPQMNFIYNASFPEFDSQPVLPATVKLSDTLFIPLSSISYVDSIYVKIWDNYFNGANRKYVRIAFGYTSIAVYNGNKLIYIPPALLNQLSAGNDSYISIEAIKANYQVVAGKKFLFNTVTAIKKPIISITN